MEENEKYIAILYEKITYDVDNVLFLFKPIEVIHDCEIDFETNILTNKTKKEYLSIEDEILAFSEETLCYGYPLSEADLEEQFPDSDKEERIRDYYECLLDTVIFGVYDQKADKIKNILAPKDILINLDDDDWFFNFEIELGENQEQVNIPISSVRELIERIDEEDYETVRNYLNNISFIQQEVINGNIVFDLDLEDIDNKEQSNVVTSKEKDLDEIIKEINPVLDELNELVGLENVKDEVKKLIKYLIFIDKTNGIIDVEKPNLNMVFKGNPGTGKTTVARIISKLMYKMGYLKNDKFAEITPKELIAEYVGQTAIKTSNFIKKHKGGVIFIDEAYVFSSKAQEFAQEAIVEIIKEMEKNETIFIFAGYKDEMKKFVQFNPGMTSRIGYFLDYEDYTVDELYEIFKSKVKKAKLKIEPAVEGRIKEIFEKVKDKKHFGNGRFIDKIFMKILLEHSLNTEKIKSKKGLQTLTVKDIPDSIVESLLYESEDIFDNQDTEFEKVIAEITDLRTDDCFEELITKVIMEKLYESSYDNIATITNKKIKECAPRILEDVKKRVEIDQKVKRKEPNRIGF